MFESPLPVARGLGSMRGREAPPAADSPVYDREIQAHLAELEAQMRDNQTRKTVFPMTETERALNSGLLSRVRGEAGAM